MNNNNTEHKNKPIKSPTNAGDPTDTPVSPRGKLKLKSFRLVKKITKQRKFICKSCGEIKTTVQGMNDPH